MEENKLEQLETLKEMKSLMERSSRFISLSGLSGVIIGITALAAAFLMYRYFGNTFHYPDHYYKIFDSQGYLIPEFIRMLFTIGIGALVVAVSAAVILTARKAKKRGLSIWDKTAERMILNISLPLITGGIFILILIHYRIVYLISPATLIFYGLALINGSKYTLNDIRFLGMAEIAIGLISAYYIGYPLLFWAIGFGVLHILYGIYMYIKYDQ